MSQQIKIVSVTFTGGSASAEDLSALRESGVDPAEIAAKLNALTGSFKGLKFGARIYVAQGGKYRIELVPPSITELLLFKAKAEKPSGDPAKQKVGDISIEDVAQAALVKKSELLTKDLRKAIKTVLGTARSIGLTVEGKDPRVVSAEVEQGLYRERIEPFESLWREA
ncbi:MAG: hypothetical protein QXU97_02805 [Fervidicoccaceae archaeon]